MDRKGGELQSEIIDTAYYSKVKPVRTDRGRRAIALRNPVAQEMWARGYGVVQISQFLGIRGSDCSQYFGFVDPTPQPLGCPPFAGRAGESGEARAFRRFPINAHKPG